MLTADLGSGASFDWEDHHGDEALFVQRGEHEVEGRRCPEGGAVVIEADARPIVRTTRSSRVVHMGPRDPAPPRDGLHGPASARSRDVHVVGPRGIFEAREKGRDTHFFADSTCPGCRLWLLYTSRSFAWETSVHSHSQDELVYLLEGEIRLGSFSLEPGSTVFIAADQPYQLRSGEDGFAFINYRRDASEMTTRATGEKILEAGEATGLTRVSDSL
jgi:quercetin dioxygenase-like cupin family protein